MTAEEFRNTIKNESYIGGGSPLHLEFHAFSQRAMKLTCEMNYNYHTPEELRSLMSKLTQSEIDETFGIFPPFYTDCGINIHIGKNVFINSGCKFQDQGGIFIDDGALIGHNVVIATLNHDMNPTKRASMIAQPIHIGKNVWIGSNTTIFSRGVYWKWRCNRCRFCGNKRCAGEYRLCRSSCKKIKRYIR